MGYYRGGQLFSFAGHISIRKVNFKLKKISFAAECYPIPGYYGNLVFRSLFHLEWKTQNWQKYWLRILSKYNRILQFFKLLHKLIVLKVSFQRFFILKFWRKTSSFISWRHGSVGVAGSGRLAVLVQNVGLDVGLIELGVPDSSTIGIFPPFWCVMQQFVERQLQTLKKRSQI